MICRNCLRAASRSRIFSSITPSQTRFLTTTPTLRNAPPASQTTPSPTNAQPLSAPITPSPSPDLKTQAADAAAAKKKAAPLVKSSIPAGTPLKGLNFEKNKQDPIALADDEYPDWLWGILKSKKEGSEGGVGAGDLFSKSKKQRRLAAKRLRKEEAMNPGLHAPKIPVYEQTTDLPAGDGSLDGAVRAAEARGELTKAMRGKRRAGIKEKNFLKAMG